jgi:cytochrome b6-f complex iron-sulfur subunit
MNRRDFLSWVGVGWVAASLPVAIAACSPTKPPQAEAPTTPSGSATPPEPPPGSVVTPAAPPPPLSDDGFVNAGPVAELQTKGSFQLKTSQDVIVIQDPKNPGGVLAFTAICNHKDCLVQWKPGDSQFVCPCHDSRFGTDGTLVKGPATEGLKTVEVKVDGEKVMVKG